MYPVLKCRSTSSNKFRLGGTLSPPLALALVSAGAVPADSTLTYAPSSRPTIPPGNLSASFGRSRLDPQCRHRTRECLVRNRRRRSRNTFDIVPQSGVPFPQNRTWATSPPIYGKPLLPIVLGSTIIFALHALSSGALFSPLLSQYFTGPPPLAPCKSLKGFHQNVGPAHLEAYLDEASIVLLWLVKSQVPGSGLRG